MPWAPNYCEPTDLAAYQQVGDEADIVQLELAVSAASRAVDGYCRRQFGQLAEVEQRTYPLRFSGGRWVADIDDLAVAGLVVAVDDTPVDEVVLEPHNAVLQGRVWTRLAFAGPAGLRGWVSVTARWGWPAVPYPVTQATLLQANRLMSRRNSPFGVAGSPQQGSELRLLARLDPDVVVMLRGYVRPPLAVA